MGYDETDSTKGIHMRTIRVAAAVALIGAGGLALHAAIDVNLPHYANGIVPSSEWSRRFRPY